MFGKVGNSLQLCSGSPSIDLEPGEYPWSCLVGLTVRPLSSKRSVAAGGRAAEKKKPPLWGKAPSWWMRWGSRPSPKGSTLPPNVPGAKLVGREVQVERGFCERRFSPDERWQSSGERLSGTPRRDVLSTGCHRARECKEKAGISIAGGYRHRRVGKVRECSP